MNKILKDYKKLLLTNGELNYQADAGQTGEEIYEYSDFIQYIKKLCKEYDIEFNEKDIDKEWYNYVQSKSHQVEEKLEKIIFKKNEDIFSTYCKLKNIDEYNITADIYSKIECSEIDDTAIYIGENEIYNDLMETIGTKTEVFVDYCIKYGLLLNKEEAIKFYKKEIENDWELEELWVELNKKEKDFLKLADKFNVKILSIDYFG